MIQNNMMRQRPCHTVQFSWTPEIYKIKLYRIVIILYSMHTKNPKKNIPLLE